MTTTQEDLGTVTVLSGLDSSAHVLEAASWDGLERDIFGTSVDLYNGFYQFR